MSNPEEPVYTGMLALAIMVQSLTRLLDESLSMLPRPLVLALETHLAQMYRRVVARRQHLDEMHRWREHQTRAVMLRQRIPPDEQSRWN